MNTGVGSYFERHIKAVRGHRYISTQGVVQDEAQLLVQVS